MKSLLCWCFLCIATLAAAQPADIHVRVSTISWIEGGINGPCWEGGVEEYSAKVWVADDENPDLWHLQTFTCNANGNCTLNPKQSLLQLKQSNINQLNIRFEAWEDDQGDRLVRDVEHLSLTNDDDCGCGPAIVGRIDFRKDPNGQWNSYGPFQCSGDHRVYLEVFYEMPLSYQLADFDGFAEEGANVLQWEMAGNWPVEWFIVERQLPNEEWQEIGWVSGKTINAIGWQFQFKDNFPQPEAGYRIKSWSGEQAANTSAVIGIYRKDATPNFVSRIFPNPTSGLLHIEFNTSLESQYSVNLIGPSGQLLFKKAISPNQLTNSLLTLDLSHHTRGMYFLQISNGQQQVVEQIFKS